MKIDNSMKSLGNVGGDNRAKPAGAAGAPASAAPGAQVQLSSLSSSLQQAEATISATPVVDQSRVDEIKAAMSEGRFKVDAEKVADGLIESVRQMLQAQPGRA